MLLAPHVAVVFGSGLVELKAAVRHVLRKTPLVPRPFGGRHRHEAPCDLQILTQHFERIDAGDRGANRKAHGVTQCVTDLRHSLADGAAISSETLHSDGGNALSCQLWKDSCLKTPEVGVETVERQLTGIEGISERQHPEMNFRILVAGEANE